MKKKAFIIIIFACLFSFLNCLTMQAKSGPKVCETAVTYRSIDQHGDSLLLSGLVSTPIGQTPKGIILIPHYTIAADKEAPSNKATGEAKYFRDDFVLLMPDYIGYGITKDRPHPYLHGELTAHNCVDMVLGVQHVLDSLNVTIPRDSIYIVGYSQGGASALWTLKLIEEHYADRLHVKYCFAGSGPYDVASSYDEAVTLNRSGLPATIPFLTIGTDVAYDLHLNREKQFTQATIRILDEYILSKNHGIASLYFRMLNHTVTHWMSDYGRDKSQPETARLYKGLLRSSLVHYPVNDHPLGQDSICPSWPWTTPTYIFHSTNDDIVPVLNALHLRRCYGNRPNVTFDIDKFGNHMRSSKIFLKRVQDKLNIPCEKL